MKPKLTPFALELIRKAEAKELSKMKGKANIPDQDYHPSQPTPRINLDRIEGSYFENDSDNNL